METVSTDDIAESSEEVMLGDEGFVSDVDYEESSSSESVDVSSGYDDSSSDENAAQIKQLHHEKDAAARVRNSDKLVEMIQVQHSKYRFACA